MTKVWLTHCACLDKQELFLSAMEVVSPYRREKVNHAKSLASKRQVLGAGILLAHALNSRGLREREMSYQIEKSGKPFLKTAPNLFFSLSHSENWALCALGDDCVGADVQTFVKYVPRVARRCFLPKDAARLEKMKETARDEEFTRLWAARESQVKWLGGWNKGREFPPVKEYFELNQIRIAVCTWDECCNEVCQVDLLNIIETI